MRPFTMHNWEENGYIECLRAPFSRRSHCACTFLCPPLAAMRPLQSVRLTRTSQTQPKAAQKWQKKRKL